MTATAIALLVRPLFNGLLLFCIVWPLAWLLYRVFPHGRIKVFLFRHRTGPYASTRDKVVMVVAVIVGYAGWLAWLVYLSAPA